MWGDATRTADRGEGTRAGTPPGDVGIVNGESVMGDDARGGAGSGDDARGGAGSGDDARGTMCGEASGEASGDEARTCVAVRGMSSDTLARRSMPFWGVGSGRRVVGDGKGRDVSIDVFRP